MGRPLRFSFGHFLVTFAFFGSLSGMIVLAVLIEQAHWEQPPIEGLSEQTRDQVAIVLRSLLKGYHCAEATPERRPSNKYSQRFNWLTMQHMARIAYWTQDV